MLSKCGWCAAELELEPNAYDSCPNCRTSFSFKKPTWIAANSLPTWGAWRLTPNLCLTHSSGYEIDLELIDSSASLLDWLYHVGGKAGATSNGIHDLIQAFQDILNPQANYCSMGVERGKPGTGSRLVKAYLASHPTYTAT